jgi:pentatricopeptide repeat protein
LQNAVIKAYTRIGLAARADGLIKELESLSRRESDTVREDSVSDVMTMGATLHAWCRDNTTDIETAIERSDELLQRIDTKYRDGLVGPNERHVDGWVFENVIRLWSGSRKPEAPERIASLIVQMESLHKEVPFLFKPNPNVYLLALDAWAKSGRTNAGRQAMAILRKVEKLHTAGEIPEPNIRMLSSTLVSLTRSSGPRICSMAEGLYRRILERYKAGDRSAAVNTRTLTSLMTMILNIPGYDSAKRAQFILRETIDLGRDCIRDLAPNTIVFNCMLNGLAKRRDSDTAWELLHEMKSLHSEGYPSEPDNASYSCVARAVAGDTNSESTKRLKLLTSEIFVLSERDQLKPDIQLFNTILNGFSFTSKFDSTCAFEASDLLTTLEMSSLTRRNPVEPDIESYTAVCHAFAHCKHPDAARQAEETFLRAYKLAKEGKIGFPGTEFYSFVVLAHAKNGRQVALDKAESIIEKMESSFLAGNTHVQPITFTYNMVLSACASSGNIQTANSVFEKLKASFAAGNKKCVPDTNTHNWVRDFRRIGAYIERVHYSHFFR